MSRECHWIDSKLEDLVSGDPELRAKVDAHVAGCARCRTELAGYEKLDHLLATYVQRQAERASRPHAYHFRYFRMATAGIGLAVAVLAVWLVAGGRALGPFDTALVKAEDTPETLRAKPEPAPGENASAPLLTADTAPPQTENFSVSDAAGYFYSLADFSDTVIILGVFDASGRGMEGFEGLTETYRAVPGLRLLAVRVEPSASTDPTLASSLPMMTNQGSRLVDTPAGGFSIIGRDGEVHGRGSLDDDSLDENVAASLMQLGVNLP